MSFKPMLNQPSQVAVAFKKIVHIAGKRHTIVPDTYFRSLLTSQLCS